MSMHVLTLVLELQLPGCSSLKEKRGRLKPLIAALHKQFNVSAAEIDHQDAHQSAVVACALVCNSDRHGQGLLERIPRWVERHRPDLDVIDHQISPW